MLAYLLSLLAVLMGFHLSLLASWSYRNIVCTEYEKISIRSGLKYVLIGESLKQET